MTNSLGFAINDIDRDLAVAFEWFHRHPERALAEMQTTSAIRELLAQMPGVELLDLGLETGALARITGTGTGPVVGLRSDIDALPICEATGLAYASEHPGLMHACGHDYHLTNLLGAVRVLGQMAADDPASVPGTVVAVFQPAEEVNGGADLVIATGRLQELGVTHMLAMHIREGLPAGTIAIKEGPLQASVDHFTITVHGKGCHAAYPHLGLDPIVGASRLVGALQEITSRLSSPFDPVVVSVGRFTAGSAFNIIPDEAELEGTVRTFDDGVRAAVETSIRARCAALEAEGYQVRVCWIAETGPVVNDGHLAQIVRDAALEQGLPLVDDVAVMGGEDFSDYARIATCMMYKVGVGTSSALHTARIVVDPTHLPATARHMAACALAMLRQLG